MLQIITLKIMFETGRGCSLTTQTIVTIIAEQWFCVPALLTNAKMIIADRTYICHIQQPKH